jgi:hypothetical protein
MSELVQKLSTGNHPVIVSLRPTRSAAAFKECLDRGYVLVKFTDTRGGTELGVKLDPDATDLSKADFVDPAGSVSLAGDLTLDYVRVRCSAEIDLATLTGTGRLQPLDPAPAS